MQHLAALAKRHALTLHGRPCRLVPVADPDNTVLTRAIVATSLEEPHGGAVSRQLFDVKIGREHPLMQGDKVEVLDLDDSVLQTITISKESARLTELVIYVGVEL